MQTRQEPVSGEKIGLPRKSYIEKEAEVIKAASASYRFLDCANQLRKGKYHSD